MLFTIKCITLAIKYCKKSSILNGFFILDVQTGSDQILETGSGSGSVHVLLPDPQPWVSNPDYWLWIERLTSVDPSLASIWYGSGFDHVLDTKKSWYFNIRRRIRNWCARVEQCRIFDLFKAFV